MQQNDIGIELDKRRIILKAFQKGLTHYKASENIEAKYGDCIGYGTRTCERWFTKFRRNDFDLTKKPRDKKGKEYTKKRTKKPAKSVKTKSNVSDIKFKQAQKPSEEAPKTVLKYRPPAEMPSTIPLKVFTALKKTISAKEKLSTPKSTEVATKLRPRRSRSKGIEIQLSAGEAKNMKTQTLTENHSIGQSNINYSSGRESSNNPVTPASKELTVQFQNISPNIAKNTMKKPPAPEPQTSMPRIVNVAHIDYLSPEKKSPERRISVLPPPPPPPVLSQTSPLNNPKGVIYLNPQEIFPKSFGRYGNVTKRPNPTVKSVQQTKNYRKSSLTRSERKDSVIQLDSDGSEEEDVLFPENISLPAPKTKTNDTFATYWDMESGKLMQINPDEPVVPQHETPVIEID